MNKEKAIKTLTVLQIIAGIAILCVFGATAYYALGWAGEIQAANKLVLTDNLWGFLQYGGLLFMVAVTTGFIMIFAPIGNYIDKHCKTMGLLEYIQKRKKS